MNKQVRTIFLDEYHRNPVTISAEAFELVTQFVQQNLVCQVCAEAYTQERPQVVRNTCLTCFLQSNAARREKQLTYVGEAGLACNQRAMQHAFIDADGYVFIVYSDMEYQTLERSNYHTLLHWGFIIPNRVAVNGVEERIDTTRWYMYGDFRVSNVLVLHYLEPYGKRLDLLFFAYKGEGIVAINKRKKEIRRLFQEAKAQLEATRDVQGRYRLGEDWTTYQIEEGHLYPLVARIANREYTPPLLSAKQLREAQTTERELIPFATSPKWLTRFLEDVTITEIHADGEREERSDILVLYVAQQPLFLVVYNVYPYGVIVRCEEDEADFCLQSGSDVLYAKWYHIGDEILELNTRNDTLTWLAAQQARLDQDRETD